MIVQILLVLIIISISLMMYSLGKELDHTHEMLDNGNKENERLWRRKAELEDELVRAAEDNHTLRARELAPAKKPGRPRKVVK